MRLVLAGVRQSREQGTSPKGRQPRLVQPGGGVGWESAWPPASRPCTPPLLVKKPTRRRLAGRPHRRWPGVPTACQAPTPPSIPSQPMRPLAGAGSLQMRLQVRGEAAPWMEGLVVEGERGEWRVRGVSSAQPANSPHDNVPRAARGPTRGDRLDGYRGEGASTEASHHPRPCHAPRLLLTRSPSRPPPHPPLAHHRQPHRNVRGRRCRRRAGAADGQEPTRRPARECTVCTQHWPNASHPWGCTHTPSSPHNCFFLRGQRAPHPRACLIAVLYRRPFRQEGGPKGGRHRGAHDEPVATPPSTPAPLPGVCAGLP